MIKAKLGKRQKENLQKSLGKEIYHAQITNIMSYDRATHISSLYHETYYKDEHRREHNVKYMADNVKYNINVVMRYGFNKDAWDPICFFQLNPYKFSYTITKCNEGD